MFQQVVGGMWRHTVAKNVQPLCRLNCMVVTQLMSWWSW